MSSEDKPKIFQIISPGGKETHIFDGKDELERMVPGLVDGKVGWVDEEYVRTIDEAR